MPLGGSLGIGISSRLTNILEQSVNVVTNVISWLLSFATDGTATVPSDGTGDVTDNYSGTGDRYVRAWDSTNGLVLQAITGKAFISEGMRWTGTEFVNNDGSGNKLHPTHTYVDADGNTQEAYSLYDARTNGESVASEAGRYTGDADPHNHYYLNQTLASPATTSLVSPLRDSNGRYYEELVKNGGMDVSAEWTDGGSNWAIGSGVATHSTGATETLSQDTGYVTQGSFYNVTFTTASTTAGSVTVDIAGTSGTARSTNDTFSEIITAGSGSIDIAFTPTTDFDGSIDNVSYYECVSATDSTPTNILDGGRRESQTNLQVYSELFSNSAWAKSNVTLTDNDVVAPDGTTTATRVTETTANDIHGIYDIPAMTSRGVTSIFLKQGTSQYGFLQAWDNNSNRTTIVVDLADGTITDTTTTGTPSTSLPQVIDAGNGWYRLSVVSNPSTNTIILFGLSDSATPSYNANGVPTYTGVATEYIYAWGAMAHEGMGPSDRPAFEYIPTTSATVTATENVDESVLWTYGGYYSNIATASENFLPHVINHPSYTQYLLQSETPATQTTGSLATGTYTLWVDDSATGSATVAANTATITGAGVATAGSPVTFTVTGAGTVDVTVAATVNKFQLNNGGSRLPYLISTTGTVTAPATDFESSPTISDYLRFRIAPRDTTSAQVWFSDGTSKIGFDGTNVYVTDGTNTASAAQAIAMGDEVGWDATTGKLYYNNSVIATDATVSITWGATIQIGADVSGGSPVTVTNGGLTDWYTASSGVDLTDATWRTP